MWLQLNRLCKPTAAMVFTASQPFTSMLIMSNLKAFKYCWVWDKKCITGFANAKKQPLRCVEDVIVFGRGTTTYNPQGTRAIKKTVLNGETVGGDTLRGDTESSKGKGALRTKGSIYTQDTTNYPRQIIAICAERSGLHSTQKPVALLEYLIRTYTNDGDTVLDFTMGSGTTGVACRNLNRSFVGIEMDVDYFKIAKERIGGERLEVKPSEGKGQVDMFGGGK